MLLQTQCVLQTRRCTARGLLGQRKDATATSLIAERFSAMDKAVAGVKFLIDRKNRQVKDVISAVQNFREAGYEYSFAWGDTKGLRLLPVKAEPDCRAVTDAAEARYWHAVDNYVAVYPQLVKEREQKLTGLGLLFDGAEYPPQNRIRSMFECKVEYMPVPDSGHFVADLADDVAKEAKAELTRTINVRANEAVNDILSRVETGVGKYLDKLSRYRKSDSGDVEQTFRDGITHNVTALADLVKKLNFSDDPGLNNLAEQINRLARYSAERLRDDNDARRSMISEGQALVARLDAMRKVDNEIDELIDSVGDYMRP